MKTGCAVLKRADVLKLAFTPCALSSILSPTLLLDQSKLFTMLFSLATLVLAVFSGIATAAPNDKMVILVDADPPTPATNPRHRIVTQTDGDLENCYVRFRPLGEHCPDDKVSRRHHQKRCMRRQPLLIDRSRKSSSSQCYYMLAAT